MVRLAAASALTLAALLLALLLGPDSLVAGLLGSGQLVAQPPPAPTVDVIVEGDRVTVGDPIRVTVVVRFDPAAVGVDEPAELATLGDLEPAFPSRLTTVELPDGGRELRVLYETRAFRTGPLIVQPPPILWRAADGTERVLEPPAASFTVASVLPPEAGTSDLTLRPLKPARTVEGAGAPLGLIGGVAGGIGTALIAALVAWRWRAQRRRRGEAVPGPAVATPADRVARELDRLGRLPASAESARLYCTTITQSLRDYFTDVYRLPANGLTTSELPDRLLQAGADSGTATLVRRLFDECDAVAYAGVRPAPGRLTGYLELAHSIVAPREAKGAQRWTPPEPPRASWARPADGTPRPNEKRD